MCSHFGLEKSSLDANGLKSEFIGVVKYVTGGQFGRPIMVYLISSTRHSNLGRSAPGQARVYFSRVFSRSY